MLAIYHAFIHYTLSIFCMLGLSIRNTRKRPGFHFGYNQQCEKIQVASFFPSWLRLFGLTLPLCFLQALSLCNNHDIAFLLQNQSKLILGSLSPSLEKDDTGGSVRVDRVWGFVQGLPKMRAGESRLISFSSGIHLAWTVQPAMCMGFFPVIVSDRAYSVADKTSAEVESPRQLEFLIPAWLSPYIYIFSCEPFLIFHYFTLPDLQEKGLWSLNEEEASPKVIICHLSTFPDRWDLLSKMVAFRWVYVTNTHRKENLKC